MGRHVEGNNVSLSVHPDTKRDAGRIFTELSDGGTVTIYLSAS
jgi:uncharacterized glyoxalase superfamily protein PhnB